jgi:glutamate--cysteine ligase
VPTSAAGLAELLAGTAHSGPGLVGLELETAVLRADDLKPAGYAGEIQAILQRLLDSGAYPTPVREGPNLIALEGERGQTVTLEPGGQLELSTSPCADLLSLKADVERCLGLLTEAAKAEGLLLVGGSLFPAAQEAMPWMPKARYDIMRDYFAGLGEGGSQAPVMMRRTLSVQVSLDFRDGADAAELLRLAFLAAPVVTAVFAASPFDGFAESGFLSTRAEAWRFTDPARAGVVEACAAPGSTLLDYADYALDVPMVFRAQDGVYSPMHGASFRALAERGRWEDGTPLTLADLWVHLGGIFTDARLKKGLVELRSTDGQPPGDVLAIPAFWVGLCYDAESRAAALELLGAAPPEARAKAHADVPRLALDADWGGRRVGEVGSELVALARAGLERRVAAGMEQEAGGAAPGRATSAHSSSAWPSAVADPRPLPARPVAWSHGPLAGALRGRLPAGGRLQRGHRRCGGDDVLRGPARPP